MEEKTIEITCLLDYVEQINSFEIGTSYSILINNLNKMLKKIDLTKTNEQNIDNATNILNYLEYMINDLKDKPKNYKLFYRGDIYRDYGKPYPLSSGIYRSNNKHDEYYYFNNIQVQCASIFKNMNNLEKLVYMQHYGCPTRLLDITSNPLVALYFACMPLKYKTDTKTSRIGGCVNVFAVDEEDVLFSLSDRILMLTKFAEFKNSDQIKIAAIAGKEISSGSDKFLCKTNQEYQENIIERFYHAVKTSNPAFTRKIKPIDLLQPQFVQPLKNNDRILKQDGAFIISGLDNNENDSNDKISQNIVRTYVIREDNKKKILTELENFGICQATLFPEVSEVAEYLKNKK